MEIKKFTTKMISLVITGILFSSTTCILSAAKTTQETEITTNSTINQSYDESAVKLLADSSEEEPPIGDPPDGQPPEGGDGGGSTGNSGTSAYTINSTDVYESGKTYSSTSEDENALRVTEGGEATITNATITKTGDTSSEEDSNFYGLNAAVLVEDGSTLTISNFTLTTDSDGSNGIFSTGENSIIYVSNASIQTSQNSSRGLDATYDGTIIADNVTITTEGAHCAALATDRGEGNITVTNAVGSTSGEGSPGIYSTGNITVSDSTLTATGSEAAVVEGKNSITLEDVTITGYVDRGVMLYQSTSGDADVGTSSFTMSGGSLTAKVGPLFYVTNTDSVVSITNTVLSQTSGILIEADEDRWGTSGSNGGNVTFTSSQQALDGDVVCGSSSSIALEFTNNTSYIGAINEDNSDGTLTLSLDSSSTWNVTSNSYLSVLIDSDETFSNINDNGYIIYYDASQEDNSWLDGNTYDLQDGGQLMPLE